MKQVALPTTIAFGATASAVNVNRVNVAQDDSGDWQIGVQLQTESPDRVGVGGLHLNENHRANAQITVTRKDILKAAVAGGVLGIDTETATEQEIRQAVRALSLEAVEGLVTQIAMGKLLGAFGISV
jgi:hypothetical protein